MPYKIASPLTVRLERRAPLLPNALAKVSSPVFWALSANVPLTVPASVSAPLFLMMVSAVSVMAPPAVAAALLELKSAPEALRPVPARLSALAMLKPLRSSAPPAETETPPADAPRAEALPACTAPSLIVVPPP